MYLTLAARGGGGGLPYEKGGDARREISNEPLKGTNQKHRDKQLVSMNLIAINIKTCHSIDLGTPKRYRVECKCKHFALNTLSGTNNQDFNP